MGTQIGPHTLLPSRAALRRQEISWEQICSSSLDRWVQGSLGWRDCMNGSLYPAMICSIDFDKSSFHQGKKVDNLLVLLISISSIYRYLFSNEISDDMLNDCRSLLLSSSSPTSNSLQERVSRSGGSYQCRLFNWLLNSSRNY